MFLKRFPAGWMWPVSGSLLAHDARDGTQGGGSRELRGAFSLARRGKGELPGLRGGKGQAGREQALPGGLVGRFQGGGLSGGAGLGGGKAVPGPPAAPVGVGVVGGVGLRWAGFAFCPQPGLSAAEPPAGSCPSLSLPGTVAVSGQRKRRKPSPWSLSRR